MIYLCLGRRELGKTTLALFMAKRSARVVVLDPRHQFGIVGPDHVVGDLPVEYPNLETEWNDDQPVIVVQPGTDLQASVDTLAVVVRDKIMSDRHLKLAVILDESALYDLKSWNFLFRTSPRDRLTIILTAHRPQDISTVARSLADVWCLFRMTQEHDLQVIEDRCGRDVAIEVEKLPPHQFVAFNDAKGTMVVYRDPSAWRVDFGQRRTAIAPGSDLEIAGGEVPSTKQRLF